MKYLILFLTLVLFSSYEADQDTTLIKGEYTLISYEKINCDNKVSDFTWKGAKNIESDISISGTLDISFFGLFTQKLFIESTELEHEVEIKFIGAFTFVSQDEWLAEFSDSPFEEGDCEAADITIDGDTLTWVFLDDDSCEIIMTWSKD